MSVSSNYGIPVTVLYCGVHSTPPPHCSMCFEIGQSVPYDALMHADPTSLTTKPVLHQLKIIRTPVSTVLNHSPQSSLSIIRR